MEAISIAILGIDPPTVPCRSCGAENWRESVDGELIGQYCLECGTGASIADCNVRFGPPRTIEMSLEVEPHDDGSATLHFG